MTSLYDLLNVAPDASESEIKAAWKSAIADLDPSDRRFRAYNQAAEVLLDPSKRAAHDADLAVEEAAAQAAETSAADASPPTHVDLARAAAAPRPVDGGAAGRTIPGWLLIAVAVVTALAIAACAWAWTQPSDDSIADGTRAAQSAAERAIVPILSYDAARLDEDQAAAQSYMTDDYRSEYDKLFAVIKDNAPNTETVVVANVLASGIVVPGDERVEVLLFVDQATTNKQVSEPIVYKNQVRVKMQKVGGEWLVDCLLSTPDATCS